VRQLARQARVIGEVQLKPQMHLVEPALEPCARTAEGGRCVRDGNLRSDGPTLLM
jgi:hypothetical protein